MRRTTFATIICLIAIIAIIAVTAWLLSSNSRPEATNQNSLTNNSSSTMGNIQLPNPKKQSQTSVEKAIANRRSVRDYKQEPLTLTDISQLLWAAQGITDPDAGKRAAPSAGALYPMEVYVAVQNAEGLDPGIYHYLPPSHELEEISGEEVASELSQAALGQKHIAEAPVNLIIAGDPSVVTSKYGERGIQYTHMEAGHVAQNVYLQAESLNLGTVTVGALQEEKIRQILDISSEYTPYYIMPVGKK